MGDPRMPKTYIGAAAGEDSYPQGTIVVFPDDQVEFVDHNADSMFGVWKVRLKNGKTERCHDLMLAQMNAHGKITITSDDIDELVK